MSALLATSVMAADKKEPAKKPAAEKKVEKKVEKKEVKKHKKAEGTKVPEPAKKK